MSENRKFVQILRERAVLIIIISSMLLSFFCTNPTVEFIYRFDNIPDRIWIGEDFWTVPIEDWQVKNHRVECKSNIEQASISLLSAVLNDRRSNFNIQLDMGLINEGENHGHAGIQIGVRAKDDSDIRAAVYFGTGIKLGISTQGYAFLGNISRKLPENFDFSNFTINLSGEPSGKTFHLKYLLTDNTGITVAKLEKTVSDPLDGIVQLVNNFKTIDSKEKGPQFWFDNVVLQGKKFDFVPENRFGPVLWTMYTLSDNILKMSAQLPPISTQENQQVHLQIEGTNGWETISSQPMDPDARMATFRIKNWISEESFNYRIAFDFINSQGKLETALYPGVIQADPVDRPLRMGALTCQYHYGFPYTPLVNNLAKKKADILYFSGDQLYEINGGYSVRRSPEDLAILSYLGKWYMFGWAFGDLMRNVPTICTPDDHDVFHGNLWGDSGVPFANQEIINETDVVQTSDLTGFAQTVKFVNVVNQTQCAHLPDPYDPTPIEQGMTVWYTALNYGRISFAIVSDRIFKSGPEDVSFWEGRNDLFYDPLPDPSVLERPNLELLGQRQEKFLNEWIRDWKNTDMKVLLSQTIFAHVSNFGGTYETYIFGDLDSGGWPKTARDRTLRMLRKAFVFHIAGDQHVPSLVQYGVDEFRDAGWCYVTPAIATGYPRWFRPDDLEIPVQNRPEHGLPNTGEYWDAFNSPNYVYAIGNPGDFDFPENRYQLAQLKASGFGLVIFDQSQREITMESWRFLADLDNPSTDDQHTGWPLTISQFDNYGREGIGYLPKIRVVGDPNPVIEIINEKNQEMEYIVRMKGKEHRPKVFSNDLFTIRIGYPESNIWKTYTNTEISNNPNSEILVMF